MLARFALVFFSLLSLPCCETKEVEHINSANVDVKIDKVVIGGCLKGYCNSLYVSFQVTNHTPKQICFDNLYSSRAVINYLPILNPDKMDVNYNLMNYPTDMYMPLQPNNLDAYIDFVKKNAPIVLKENEAAYFSISINKFFKNEKKLTENDLQSYAHLNFFVFDCQNPNENYMWQNIESKILFE